MHYVFRMLYSNGVSVEALGIGNPDTEPRENGALSSYRWARPLPTPAIFVAGKVLIVVRLLIMGF
jgi:glucuronate isomerase